jgi:molybdopterin biosynthesis enzyme MoaB
MRSPLKLTALLALVLFAFSLVGGTGVGAQDDMEDSLQPSDLEGIEYGVSRSWTMDYEAMMADTTPSADMAMPEGVLFIGGMVLEFDDDGNAEAGFDSFMDELETEDLATSDEATVEEWDIELGNQSASYSSIEEVEGVESEVVVSVVQEDNYLYIVSAAGSGEDMKDTTTSLMETMIDNDGSGEGEYNEDGTSSGGLWGKLPAADDEAVAGLIAFDEMIYPEPEEDDAS